MSVHEEGGGPTPSAAGALFRYLTIEGSDDLSLPPCQVTPLVCMPCRVSYREGDDYMHTSPVAAHADAH